MAKKSKKSKTTPRADMTALRRSQNDWYFCTQGASPRALKRLARERAKEDAKKA